LNSLNVLNILSQKLLGGLLNCLDDLGIPGAAADIALEPLSHGRFSSSRIQNASDLASCG